MAEQRVTIRLTGENANLLASLRTSSSAVERLKTDVQQLDRELERAGTRDIKVRATLESTTLQAELQRLARENVKVQVGIKTDLDTSEWQAQATAAAAAIRININADLDTTAAEAALTLLARRRQATVDVNLNSATARAQLGALTRTQSVNLRPNVDGGFLASVKAQIDSALNQLPANRRSIFGSTDDERQIRALQAELARIRDTQLNVGIDASPALARIHEISDELHKLSGESARIDVKADTAAAGAKLDEIERRVDRLNGKDAEVDVKTRQSPTAPGLSGGSGLGLLSGVAGSAGLLVSLMPQALSLLSSTTAEAAALAGQLGLAAAAGAGIVPIFGALAQGLGGVLVGTLGVKAAFKGYVSDQQSSATATSSNAAAIRGAASSLITSRQAVGRALQQQALAERNLGDAQKAAAQASRDLVAARKQEQQQEEDLASQAAGGLIAERQDVLNLKDANDALAVAKAAAAASTGSGNADALERAQIAADQAALSLADQRRENGRLAEQQASAQKQGIEGSALVVAAQDRVTQAVRAEGDARQGVTQAQQGVGDAQRALVQAQAAYADAASKAAGGASKLNEALAKLGPNQQAFVREAIKSKGALDGLKNSVGEALFAGLDGSVRSLTTGVLPLFQQQLTDTGTILNRTGKGVVEQLAGPLQGPLGNALKLNNDLLLKASPILGHLVSGFLSLYQAAGPLAKRIVDAAAGLSATADAGAKAGLESGRLTAFFDRAGDRAANLLHGIGNLAAGFKNVFTIGNEGSSGLLPGFQSLTERFRDFTSSVSGETKLRKWFDDGRAAGKQMVGLLGDVRREFGGITANTNAAGIIGGLRTAVPYVAQLVKTLSGSGETGHVLAQSLLEVAQALQAMNAGGFLTTFVGTLAGMVVGISAAVRDIPGLAPILGGLAAAAGGLLAFKLVLSPVLGLAGALKQLGTSAAGASSARLALSGVGAAVAVGTLLWGVYRQEQQRTKRAVDDVNEAISSGSVDSLKTAEDQIRKTLKATQDLQTKNDNRSGLERAGHLLDAYRASADEWTGAIGKQQAALRKAEDATRAYNTNVVQYQQTSGNAVGQTMTLTQAQQLFADAGVQVGDSYQQARQKVADYNRENGSAAQATRDLAKDMNTLADSTSSAADKADALKRVLEGISGGAEDVQKSTISYRESIDAVTESVKQNGKGLDENTARGRANGQAILAQKDALFDHLSAMAKNGATQDELKAKLDEGTDALGRSLTATTNNKDEIARYQTVLGLTPEQKATELQVLGALAAQTAIGGVQNALNGVTDKSVTLDVKTIFDANGTVQASNTRGFHEADGGVVDYYANGGVREQHVAQIARPGDWRVWAEPETGGESYIPLAPSKRERSTRIWQETGKRLGVEGFADGGIRAPSDRLSVNATTQGTDSAIGGVGDFAKAAAAAIARAMSTVSSGGSEAIKAFIRSVDPLPYIWGAVGPGGFDCSGLAGEVWARATGNPSFRRYFTTASFQPENFGMRNGTGGVLSLGFNDHHVVGNYGGLPFEAESTKTGIKVGAAATPVASMPRRYYLPGDAGSVGAAGPGLASGSGDAGNVSTGGSPRSIGQQVASSMGYGDQFSAIDYVFSHESGWNPNAKNSTSSAYGIPQFLDATWKQYGGKTADPAVQSQDGIEYMRDRYNSPNGAAAFWAAHHWYGDGGIEPGSMLNPHVRDSGGPLLPGYTYNGTGRAERVEYVQGPGRSVDLSSVSTSGMAGRTLNVGGIHVHGSDITPADVVRELAWQVR